ncbi:MAG: NADP-dependent oxidoreductase [Pseudomonadota bacterium]
MTQVNRQVILTSRPEAIPQADNFALSDGEIPVPGAGEVLVKNHFLSVDPAMRGWVSAVANYSEPVPIDGVMRSIAVGQVIASKNPDYPDGTLLCGMFGWQDYAIANGTNIWFVHDPASGPASLSLGILGLNGITAYFGLLEAGRPGPGETVLVSTAAGAVGSAVGQIAKIKGCRTVGITSSAEKQAQCRDTFGYDAAVSYREGDLGTALAQACPDGVDVYFDNTGGAISDTVYRLLNVKARVVICGTAANASWEPWPQGDRMERLILTKRATVQGILAFDWADEYDRARTDLAAWVKAGKLTYREDFLDGIEHAPGAIARLYAGQNAGKLIIRL